MNMKKVISLILAVALLLSCAPQILPVAEAVEIATPTVIYTVGDLGVTDAVIATSFENALGQIAAKNKEWEPDSVVEIQFADSVRGGAENGLLFGQTTIWRNDGTKLPITLRGVNPDSQYGAEITLDIIGGWYACANDYTFTNLTITIGNQETDFYAGCGNITFENVNFKTSGRAIQTKQDQTDAYRYALEAAQFICADAANQIHPDVSRIPAGDAWQNVRAYDAENGTNYGEGLCGTEYRGFYGDGGHDGDVGGGSYINACVYFEVMTGISCVGNTWRPTDYTLDENLVPILQAAAHKAVRDLYGEDHYTGSWTDKVGNDNAWNVLILGSSNCAYLRDELQAIAEHAGIDTRVFHAYSSGVEMQTQWDWIVSGNGKYDTHNIADGKDIVQEKQKITDFIESYEWDSIITYQTAGEFNDELPYSVEGWANVLADLKDAHSFYNWIHERCPDAGYYWYQTVAAPYGVPATDGFKGRIFADNCTQTVFSGWDALEEGEKVHTSITFGNNVNFKDNATTRVAAVGYLETAPEAAYTDATARQVKYLEATGYDDIADIRPADVQASVIINGEETLLGHVNCKLGYAPSDAALVLKNGEVFRAHAAGIEGVSETPYYGDVTMEYYKDIYISNWTGITTNITGDVTMIFDGFEWAKNMSTVTQGITVDGDFTVDVRDGSINARLYMAGNGSSGYSTVTGTATFRWGGGYISGVYTGRNGNVGNLVNEFYYNPDAEIPADTGRKFALAGESTCVVEGTIYNNFIGDVPENILKNISHFGGGDGSHTKIVNTVKADENGDATTFASFCGGVTSGTVTEIVNNIEAGTFTTFNGGSKVASGTTKITNNISGGTFSADTTFGGADSATVNTVITGGTFAFDPAKYVADGYKAKTNDGSTYTVVEEKILTVQTMPNKTIYSIGEELDVTGLELALIGGSGSVETITAGYQLSGFTSANAGKTTVTVTYGEYTTTFGLAIVDDSIVMADDSGNVYTGLSAAVQNAAAGSKLTLLQDAETDVTVGKDLYLDLNGNTVTGTVTVFDGYTLFGMDHQTDDFTVEDDLGYGVIGNIIGNVVAIPVEEDGYLMLGDDTNDDGIADRNVSFHRVDLNLTAMTLRAMPEADASKPSVYYKSNFAADEVVAGKVKTFGVALSLTEEPNADNMGVTNKFSWFDGEDFVAGGNNNDATSTLLYGIMKEENGRLTNTANATRPIYGRAYMQLDDGSYIFGVSHTGNFKTLVEGVNDKWDTCTAEQKQAVLTMYETYERIMKNWEIPAIIKAAE